MDRQNQKPASYVTAQFQNSFVYDERTLYYLQREVETMFEVKAGDNLKEYVEELANLQVKVKKDIPVYDAQLRNE